MVRPLAKLIRKDGTASIVWLHKARKMPNFKLYRSQVMVVEQSTERAALMLGSDKSVKFVDLSTTPLADRRTCRARADCDQDRLQMTE